MKAQKERKALIDAKYLRIIEVCKKDPEITNAQLVERFSVGLKKIKELRSPNDLP